MNTPVAPRRGPSRLKLFFWLVVLPVVLIALYFMAAMKWNYSTGERAGWVQKFSKKGWLCKTWEGELSMVSMPGATPEKFYFTVWDDKVAADINAAMGRRVSLHYDEKVGLPSTCFGDTRHWVNGITVVPEIQLAPGVAVPAPPLTPGGTAPGIPQPPVPSGAPGAASPPALPAPSSPASSMAAPSAPAPSMPAPPASPAAPTPAPAR